MAKGAQSDSVWDYAELTTTIYDIESLNQDFSDSAGGCVNHQLLLAADDSINKHPQPDQGDIHTAGTRAVQEQNHWYLHLRGLCSGTHGLPHWYIRRSCTSCTYGHAALALRRLPSRSQYFGCVDHRRYCGTLRSRQHSGDHPASTQPPGRLNSEDDLTVHNILCLSIRIPRKQLAGPSQVTFCT